MNGRVWFILLLSTNFAAAQFETKRSDDLGAKAFVSASDLRVPARARKEFDKANELLTKQNLTRALRKLNKAIAIHPAYADAYNNVGVIFGLLGDADREREAYKKAISIDDHFAVAYLNLGKVNIITGDFGEAESVLSKVSAFDPGDPMTLILLSYSQLKNGHFEQAIANSEKAHALSKPHAASHRVAAWIFERRGQLDRALGELKAFLEEEPAGPRADAARKELEMMQALPH